MTARFCALACLAIVSLSLLFGQDAPEGAQILARGPVHEAYAEASDPEATPAPVITKKPPEDIEEIPPEERPEGDNVVWIPGYWDWDDEEEHFLWVSGFWRVVPPGRVWVPGHWQEVTGGYAWVCGYWDEEKDAEVVEYLPPPPETVEAGPSTPAPDDDYIYAPGCWVWRVSRYLWRPGYWVRHRPGWTWTPDCYKWAPSGYVFVPGYWDAPLAERGLLYAPVYFTGLRRGFRYTPAYAVQPDFLLGSLFVRRGGRGYSFGDYFDAGHRKRYVPWVDHRPARGVYDGNYAYYRQAFATRPAWEKGLTALYAGRYAGDVARPPRTLFRQRQALAALGADSRDAAVTKTVNITNIQNVTALAPVAKTPSVRVTGLASLGGGKESAKVKEVRVTKVTKEAAAEERRYVERYREAARSRREGGTKADAVKAKAPARVRIEVPKEAPPPRRVKSPTKPPPAPPRGPDKDRVLPPVKGKDTPPPVKGKDTPPPMKGKDLPPPRDKDTRPKDKDRPPPPVKDKPPPPPPPVKDKPPPPPPPKDKPPPPPPPKDKPPLPPPVVKDKPPPPPPPPKDRPPPPPRPKDKPKE